MRYAGIITISVIVDRLLKIWAKGFLPGQAGGSFPIIDGVLHLTYIENRGAAFGIFQNGTLVLGIISGVIAVALLVYLFRRHKQLPAFLGVALSLVIGGAVGNFIDRILIGYVVDYVELRLIGFAVFNFADSCVVVGVSMLIVYILFLDRNKKGESLKEAGLKANGDDA